MSKQPIQKFLQTIGLTQKESSIYITLLELGPQAASVVAKRNNLSRPLTFFHLDKMTKKGFLNKEIRGKTQYFHPVNVQRLNLILERKKQYIDQKMIQLKQIEPLIESVQPSFSPPSKITHFEGLEGIFSLIDLVMSSHQKMSIICNPVFPEELRRYILRKYPPFKSSSEVKSELIFGGAPGVNFNKSAFVQIFGGFFSDVWVIDESQLIFKSNIIVFDGSVIFACLENNNLTGFLIRDVFLFQTMSSMVNLVKNSKGVEKII